MLKLQNIHRWVWNHKILQWIDLDIQEWQAIGLVWPNGCGKTSLLNIINWFHKSSDGHIHLYDENITWHKVEERALKWVGRVFQSFGIFKNLTLFENLSLAFVNDLHWKYKLLPLRFFSSEIKDKINDVLKQLDLYEKRNELAWNLSWWQMRLLEIARLYLQDTKLYLLDEPTAWVSPKLKWKVIDLINKIVAMWKMVIIVEHDFNFLSEFVDKFYVMNDGKIVFEWDHKWLKDSDVVNEIYFGKWWENKQKTNIN